MQIWTKEAALPVILEAYTNNKLSAQNGATHCSYRGEHGPCVIGLLIDDETAAKWDDGGGQGNSGGGSSKVDFCPGYRDLFAAKDLRFFIDLQRYHDSWIIAASDPAVDHSAQHRHHNEFRSMIGLPLLPALEAPSSPDA